MPRSRQLSLRQLTKAIRTVSRVSKMFPCPRRVYVGGKLAAYKGMLISEEQAEELGITCAEEPQESLENATVDAPEAVYGTVESDTSDGETKTSPSDIDAAARELIARKAAEINQGTEQQKAAATDGAE